VNCHGNWSWHTGVSGNWTWSPPRVGGGGGGGGGAAGSRTPTLTLSLSLTETLSNSFTISESLIPPEPEPGCADDPGGKQCVWNCARQCAKCTRLRTINGTNDLSGSQFLEVVIDVTQCKCFKNISWLGCIDRDCRRSECDGDAIFGTPPTYATGSRGSTKCDETQHATFLLPLNATTVNVQYHDGRLSGNVNCAKASKLLPGEVMCLGESGSACSGTVSGVCNQEISLSSCFAAAASSDEIMGMQPGPFAGFLIALIAAATFLIFGAAIARKKYRERKRRREKALSNLLESLNMDESAAMAEGADEEMLSHFRDPHMSSSAEPDYDKIARELDDLFAKEGSAMVGTKAGSNPGASHHPSPGQVKTAPDTRTIEFDDI
jgi:hypothetical protein